MNAQSGVERLFKTLQYTVYYSRSTDTIPPSIWNVSASESSDKVNQDITVETTDLSSVVRVVVVYTQNDGIWHRVELHQEENDVWKGQLPNQPSLEYFVQAVDGGGNVAVQDDKGHYFILGEQPSSTIYLPIILGISGRLPMDSSTKTTLFLPSVIKN